MDTVFALATAPGRSAIAVVRVTGPDAEKVVKAVAGKRPAPRKASLRTLRDVAGGVIDQGLVLWFKAPHSYTGEDSAEFHLHGGVAVIDSLTETLVALGLRPAEPGEFTRRAFERGKLDLAQAEGVADLIDAQTKAQAKQALAQIDGALSYRHEAWRGRLVEALALLEANVDFPDEDLPEDLAAKAAPPLKALIVDLETALAEGDRGERVREGYRIALIGAPNAGKSSLLNALAGRDAAIVTEIPGTTRDVVEVPMDIAGYRALLADTAGIRATGDRVEIEGVRRARAWAEGADLRLWVIDGSASGDDWRQAMDLTRSTDIPVLAKADLPLGDDGRAAKGALPVSTLTGEGLPELREAIEGKIVSALSGAEFPAFTRERHARLLHDALAHLRRALEAVRKSPELAAEDVRLAARALGRVTGRIDAEDVLDQVFLKFCIGK